MKNILFDLDGTLTDPKVGITSCIRYALEKLEATSPENLDWCIGPPLLESFRQLLPSHPPETAQQAIHFYRERFARTGMYENEVYPGIPEMLKKLTLSGKKLYVATSKPKIYADEIVRHFGLSPFFKAVYGAELDGTRSDKAELIKHALEDIGANSEKFIMIGDRKHDLIGARKNTISGVGVLWGYGTKEELESVPSIALHSSPNTLTEFILSF
jgi:phosphoglycolate phosphatase